MTRDKLIVQIELLKTEEKQEQTKISTAETNIIRLIRLIRELGSQVFTVSQLAPEGEGIEPAINR
ncbi:hypothetical protein HNQ68_003353 [Pseudochrobactrum saccharolyticum]|uniref:Uncharacterized protein n=1 Tax=Pseudochrobactrum saccharolyticum TaxID=354352 RepID=A0A7W8EPN9_9HYPH|nr:hypothetical protein [Pseudochrobactrum saccharolyticum]KAB0539866.1 hypothetical protein F7P81_00120 [Pseudochrobactrum saccharolyticum]MBB5092790.1 hypothetical protein [Pseudochrobactrum saccharolyticum]MBX8784738.1 hypothetical protein [Ochrobactrum sp. GRS2]MBX8813342.1 hypothetical protein [Ochrobactrum sp. MR34]